LSFREWETGLGQGVLTPCVLRRAPVVCHFDRREKSPASVAMESGSLPSVGMTGQRSGWPLMNVHIPGLPATGSPSSATGFFRKPSASPVRTLWRPGGASVPARARGVSFRTHCSSRYQLRTGDACVARTEVRGFFLAVAGIGEPEVGISRGGSSRFAARRQADLPPQAPGRMCR
jgi:hypothetical protein